MFVTFFFVVESKEENRSEPNIKKKKTKQNVNQASCVQYVCETEKKIKSCELRKILRDGFRLMFSQRSSNNNNNKKSEIFAQFFLSSFFSFLLKEKKFTSIEYKVKFHLPFSQPYPYYTTQTISSSSSSSSIHDHISTAARGKKIF